MRSRINGSEIDVDAGLGEAKKSAGLSKEADGCNGEGSGGGSGGGVSILKIQREACVVNRSPPVISLYLTTASAGLTCAIALVGDRRSFRTSLGRFGTAKFLLNLASL